MAGPGGGGAGCRAFYGKQGACDEDYKRHVLCRLPLGRPSAGGAYERRAEFCKDCDEASGRIRAIEDKETRDKAVVKEVLS